MFIMNMSIKFLYVLANSMAYLEKNLEKRLQMLK